MISSFTIINFLQQKINDKKQLEIQNFEATFRDVQNYFYANYLENNIVDDFFTKQKKEMRSIFFQPFTVYLQITSNKISPIEKNDIIYDTFNNLKVSVPLLLKLKDKYNFFIYTTTTHSGWCIKIQEV